MLNGMSYAWLGKSILLEKPSHNTSLQQRGKNKNSTIALTLLNKTSINLFNFQMAEVVGVDVHPSKKGISYYLCFSFHAEPNLYTHSSINYPVPVV